MDKVDSGFSFRKAMRGFNKEDVIKYISEENKRFMQEKTFLEERISETEWKLSESQKKLEEQQLMYEAMLKAKDDEIKATAAEAMQAKAELEASSSREKELSEENIRLHALMKGCEEQLKQYSEKIAEYEIICAGNASDKQEYERVKAENEYLREKYKSLEAEFRALSVKLRDMESSHTTLSSSREAKEDPFQRNNAASAQTTSYTQPTPYSFVREIPPTDRAHGPSAENPQEITEKAITSIMSINKDVKQYMSSCVDEFDSYSKDVSAGISKLVAEISERCRILDEKIKIHKQNVSDNIDSIYGSYNSKN